MAKTSFACCDEPVRGTGLHACAGRAPLSGPTKIGRNDAEVNAVPGLAAQPAGRLAAAA